MHIESEYLIRFSFWITGCPKIVINYRHVLSNIGYLAIFSCFLLQYIFLAQNKEKWTKSGTYSEYSNFCTLNLKLWGIIWRMVAKYIKFGNKKWFTLYFYIHTIKIEQGIWSCVLEKIWKWGTYPASIPEVCK